MEVRRARGRGQEQGSEGMRREGETIKRHGCIGTMKGDNETAR